MNKVTGRVVLEETGQGIADLQISLIDLDSNTKPEQLQYTSPGNVSRAIPARDIWEQLPGDRLGSVLTDGNGRFELTYEDDDVRQRNRDTKRPSLILVVTPPERSGSSDDPVLFVSRNIRRNAGRTETFLIKISSEQLEKAGVIIAPPESVVDDPDRIIEQIDQATEVDTKIQQHLQSLNLQSIEREQQLMEEFDENLPQYIEALSVVPAHLKTPENNYVAEDESVEEATENSFLKALDNELAAPGITRHLRLSEEQLRRLNLIDEQGNLKEETEIDGEELDEVLNEGRPEDPGITYTRENPLEMICREDFLPDNRCKMILEGKDVEYNDAVNDCEETKNEKKVSHNSLEDNGSFEAEVQDFTETDVIKSLKHLTRSITSPEEPVIFNKELRPDYGKVQCSRDAFQLRKSPADMPAYYDFYNIEIAFKPVWNEVIDEGIIDLSRKVYAKVVGAGGKPHRKREKKRNASQELDEEAEKIIEENVEKPPHVVAHVFGVTQELWQILEDTGRSSLTLFANKIWELDTKKRKLDSKIEPLDPYYEQEKIKEKIKDVEERIRDYRRDADVILIPAYEKLENEPEPVPELDDETKRKNNPRELLKTLRKRLKQRNYAFTIFAANKKERSVNFGLLINYRQKWEPLNYQVGELVKTIPLAPKEVRKYSKKTVIKKKRSLKEMENNLRVQKQDSSDITRAEAEIVREAEQKTGFKLSSSGNFDFGLLGGTFSGEFKQDAKLNSKETKKNFREAVLKAAQEYKNERKLEVETEESIEFEEVESGEISNPNDEITCTYLFYELQRRFRISEELHRLTPVVFVAQEVPNPGQIDEDWCIEHDWILNRVLLDDSFRPALNYLSNSITGDEIALREMRRNIKQQRKIVKQLKEEFVIVRDQSTRRSIALDRAIEQAAGIVGGESLLDKAAGLVSGGNIVTGALDTVGGFLFGNNKEENEREAARIKQQAAQDAYERALREEQELRARLEREITALNALTETYTKKLSEHLNQKVQIARLLLHIKQNILYYMQAIWSHEPDDQRYFRLHRVRVPWLDAKLSFAAKFKVNVKFPKKVNLGEFVGTFKPGKIKFKTKLLSQVADLDSPLGFMGNYMIFPLKESNPLIEYMKQPYLNELNLLEDPDELGNWTLPDFTQYVCCLRDKLTAEEFDEYRPQLKELYNRLLSSPNRTYDEIVVPTGSLYIEALPGTHPILEDFKLMHRAIDVKKVQAEVREMEMENIRAAARLLSNNLEDKDIEKKIVIEGNGHGVILPPEGE